MFYFTILRNHSQFIAYGLNTHINKNYYRAVGVADSGIFFSQFNVSFDANGKGTITISKSLESGRMGWLDTLNAHVANVFPALRYRSSGKGYDFIMCSVTTAVANSTLTINLVGYWMSDGALYTSNTAWISTIVLFYK